MSMLINPANIEAVNHHNQFIHVWFKSGRGASKYTQGQEAEYNAFCSLLNNGRMILATGFTMVGKEEVDRWR